MKPLRTREDILEFAAAHAPSKACSTAIKDGRGVVWPIKAHDDRQGWRVEVSSRHGRQWTITIWCNETDRTYSTEYI